MFLDTSGLYAYLDRADDKHADAVSLANSTAHLLTHNYVIAELIALSNARRMDRRITLEFVDAMMDDTNVTMAWVSRSDHQLAINLLRARPDKSYSLCDAVSFVLMRRHGLSDALTTDRHFEQEGFIKRLRT